MNEPVDQPDDPGDEDGDPIEPSPEHYEAIGRFIYGCSDVESRLAEVMRKATGIENEDIARAVIGIGDLRIKDYGEIIKRAFRIRGIDNPELKTLLMWVTYFNDVRNVIAHKPMVVLEGGVMWFSNYHTVKFKKNAWIYKCTAAQLRKAAELLDRLAMALVIVDMSPQALSTVEGTRFALPGEPNESLLRIQGLPDRPTDKHQNKAQ